MSGQQSMPAIATPRDAARTLIVGYVERGDPVEWLAHGGYGYAGPLFQAQIGGYLWSGPDGASRLIKRLDCWHIGVSEVNGQACAAVFSLRDIYDELARELCHGRQLPLFAKIAS